MDRLESALRLARGLANVLRGHADLGDYLPPRTTRGLAESARQLADEIEVAMAEAKAQGAEQ